MCFFAEKILSFAGFVFYTKNALKAPHQNLTISVMKTISFILKTILSSKTLRKGQWYKIFWLHCCTCYKNHAIKKYFLGFNMAIAT